MSHHGRPAAILALLLALCTCPAVLAAGTVGAADTPESVTIRVVDKATGQPVKRFTYDYRLDSPDRHEHPASRDDVEAVTTDGVIRIPAPQRCSLWVSATSPSHFPLNSHQFKILPDDRKRTFTLHVTRGATVRGVVLDAKTNKPVAGARVSPRYFGHPAVWINRERAVKTDKQGRFVLGGVNKSFGICIERPGYETIGDWSVFEPEVKLDTGGGQNTFRLQRSRPKKQTGAQKATEKIKPRLFGSVAGRHGKPVGPYRVVAAAMQDPDALWGNKEYYFEEQINDVPAGKPWELALYSDAKLYWVMAEANGFAPSTQVVKHENIDRPIQLRLRPGFSLSGRVEGPGVAQGKAVAMVQPMYLFYTNPPHQHHHKSPLNCVQGRRVHVGPDGRFAFHHLGTGSHLLQIAAPGATPVERLVTVRDRNLRLEEPLKMQATGRIEGIVYDRDGDLMVMESCHWSPPEMIDPAVGQAIWGRYLSANGHGVFTTDEHGRFVIEDAPAGRTRVGFSYNVLIDVIDTHDHQVNVLPGRTTQVRINVPKDSELRWMLPVEVVVGDGSRNAVVTGCSITNLKYLDPLKPEDAELPDVALAIEPLPGQAVSWPDQRSGTVVQIPMDGPGYALVTGIHPGKYRITNWVLRWNQCCDLGTPFLNQAVEVKPNMKEMVEIRLPDASVQLEWEYPRKDVAGWSVLVMALDQAGRPVRREFTSYCDGFRGRPPHVRPCLDFMSPGRYTLLIWRDGLGWARSKPIDVEAGKITQAGLLRFRPGATIRGRILFPELSRRPQAVVAADSAGIHIEAEAEWTPGGYKFVAKDLWPGQWTIAALDSDGRTLVERRVLLKGTEAVELE